MKTKLDFIILCMLFFAGVLGYSSDTPPRFKQQKRAILCLYTYTRHVKDGLAAQHPLRVFRVLRTLRDSDNKNANLR